MHTHTHTDEPSRCVPAPSCGKPAVLTPYPTMIAFPAETAVATSYIGTSRTFAHPRHHVITGVHAHVSQHG